MRLLLIIVLGFIGLGAVAQQVDTVRADVAKTKGVKVKVVDGTPMLNNKNIVQNVSAGKNYSILLKAIKLADLTETFESRGPITLFAPTDAAFKKLPAAELDSLLKPSHKYELSSLITYHAIRGNLSIKDIAKSIREHKGKATFITLSGSKITATIDDHHNIIFIDENGGKSIVGQFDIAQSNGMLHVVDSLFIPKLKTI